MNRRLGRFAAAALLLAGLAPATLSAQDPAMSRAFELERRGNYAAAADAYRGVLTSKAGDPAALLGLERALLPLGRSAGDRARRAGGPGGKPIEWTSVRCGTPGLVRRG